MAGRGKKSRRGREKEAIWYRMAALPHAAGATPPIREMLEKAAAAGVAPPRETAGA
jgi:hypothetical protein